MRCLNCLNELETVADFATLTGACKACGLSYAKELLEADDFDTERLLADPSRYEVVRDLIDGKPHITIIDRRSWLPA